MELTVNGTAKQVEAGMTVASLLESLALGGGRIALELNGEIIPRSEFGQCQLNDGDRLEIVQAIGGG